MTPIRLVMCAAVAFACTGLVGPGLRMVSWPPSTSEATAVGTLTYFLYFVTLFLWPALPIVTFVPNIATPVATGLAVAVNVLLFAVTGILVGAGGLASRPLVLGICWVAAIVLLLGMPLAWFPSGLDFLSASGLVGALVVYAFPCWMVWKRRLRVSV
jgi:hypothetical protein